MKQSLLTKYSPLALTLSLALYASFTHAATYSQLITFGDSLSDTGAFAKTIADKAPILGEAQPSFITNPDTTWAGVLASSYGHTADPNDNETLKGTNYAFGGAKAKKDANFVLFTVPSVEKQINNHLQTNNKADPKALYTVWIGANDLIEAGNQKDIKQAVAILTEAATSEISSINRLHDAGASTILVPNLPDVGLTPRMLKDSESSMKSTRAATLYNNMLFTGLNKSQANVVPANTFALLQETVAHKEAFGFQNANDYACKDVSSLLPLSTQCKKEFWKTPTANETYVFADDIHPAGRTHRILAQYYRSIIDTPATVGQLPQKILSSAGVNDRHLNRQIDQFSKKTSGIWADVSTSSNNKHSVNVGLDFAGENSHTGTYLNRQKYAYKLSNNMDSDVGITGIALYHRHNFGNLSLNANVGVDKLSISTNRRIDWEGEFRAHTADTSGRRLHGGVKIGYGVDVGQATIRPHIGANAQKLKIHTLTESKPNLSTAMRFGEQERKSLQGEVGVDVGYAISPAVSMVGGVSYGHEFINDKQAINASLTSIQQYSKGFNTVVDANKEHAVNYHLAINGQFEHTALQVGAHATKQLGKNKPDVMGFASIVQNF